MTTNGTNDTHDDNLSRDDAGLTGDQPATVDSGAAAPQHPEPYAPTMPAERIAPGQAAGAGDGSASAPDAPGAPGAPGALGAQAGAQDAGMTPGAPAWVPPQAHPAMAEAGAPLVGGAAAG
ncbi:MAG: hypothetical protein ACTH31_14570, partial [Pseudoclavibacter sp.]